MRGWWLKFSGRPGSRAREGVDGVDGRRDHEARVRAAGEVILKPLQPVVALAAGDPEIHRRHAGNPDQRRVCLAGLEAVAGGDAVAEERDVAARHRDPSRAAGEEQGGKK